MIAIRVDSVDQQLRQWDKGQRLVLEGIAAGTRCDFAYEDAERSLPEYAYEEDGVACCDIPDTILMECGKLIVYAYLEEGSKGESYCAGVLYVEPMPKPSDYVEPEDIPRWSDLQAQIDELKERPSGGSVAPDLAVNDPTAPGYVKNRTHWVDYDWTELVPQYEIEGVFTSESAGDGLQVGTVYRITWDGVVYEQACEMKADSDGTLAPGLGNPSIIGGMEDSGEPFIVITYEGNFGIMAQDGGTHTISIDERVEVVHPLDEKYLPPDLGGGITVTGATVGQTVRIAAVDDNGVPTAWEPVDMVAGGGCGDFRLIRSITIPDDVSTDTSGVEWVLDTTSEGESCVRSIYFDTDNDGNPFELREVIIYEHSAVAAKNYYRWGDQNSADNEGYGRDYRGNLIAQAINSTDMVKYNFHIIVSANMSFGQMDRHDNYGYNFSGTSEILLREEGPITGLRRNGYGGTGFKPGSKFVIYGR